MFVIFSELLHMVVSNAPMWGFQSQAQIFLHLLHAPPMTVLRSSTQWFYCRIIIRLHTETFGGICVDVLSTIYRLSYMPSLNARQDSTHSLPTADVKDLSYLICQFSVTHLGAQYGVGVVSIGTKLDVVSRRE